MLLGPFCPGPLCVRRLRPTCRPSRAVPLFHHPLVGAFPTVARLLELTYARN